MISKEEAKTMIDVAVKHASRRKIDGLEAIVAASDVATSRFANNGMTQNQAPHHISISVRVQNNGRQARLSSDRISAAAIKELVDNAITVASFLEPDEDMLPMCEPETRTAQKDINRYDAKTARFSADQRAQAIESIVEVANRRGLISAGVYANGSVAEAIGNSNGVFRYHRETTAEVSVTMKYVDPETNAESTGWSKQQSPNAKDIDATALAATAAEKACASTNPQELPPGKYTVVLEPSAVLDLLRFLDYDFTGTSFVDKLSCFLDKLKKPIFGTNINIFDDVYHPLQAGAPFDCEGLQRRKVRLVDKGKVENLVYGRRSAKKLNAAPTGHGLPEPSAEGEWPHNIVFTGGDVSLAEMIAGTARGILLTRVWYVREVDPSTKIVTGMTRDGTFLIENGAIKCGIKNMRFNQSLLEVLSNVTALSPAVRAAGEEGEPCVVPALKVDNFNFSSITRF